MRETVKRVVDEVPKSIKDLEQLPPHLMLLVIGGFVAVGVGFLVFLFSLATPWKFWYENLAWYLFVFIIDVVFGFLLLLAYTSCKRNFLNGIILAGIFGIVLVVAGGLAGLIGGGIAIIGAILGYVQTT